MLRVSQAMGGQTLRQREKEREKKKERREAVGATPRRAQLREHPDAAGWLRRWSGRGRGVGALLLLLMAVWARSPSLGVTWELTPEQGCVEVPKAKSS